MANEEISKGIAVLADAKTISDEAFKALVDIAFDIVLKRKTEEALVNHPVLSKLDALVVKQGYSALVSYIIEEAKADAHSIHVTGRLEELQLPEPRRKVFGASYGQNKDQLRALLFTTGWNYDHIVGVEWRLDYYIKSNKLDKINTPLYFIRLKTVSEGRPKNVEFHCSLEELQDLVTKLKSAVKQADRIAPE